MLTAAVTGHRPDKLKWSYDILQGKWTDLKLKFKELLLWYKCIEGITGMALGVDMVFALAVLELKNEGHDIKLHCAIPCLDHSSNWSDKQTLDLYEYIKSKADIVHVVTPDYYNPRYMQIRNEYMVDRAAVLFAVWNGSAGGTRKCVKYAQMLDRDIVYIHPNKI